MTNTPALADRLREDWFWIRFSWSMQDYPGREYRRIKRELRAEIAAAAADVGMAGALRDLGHPRVLAEGYKAELPAHRPRLATGALAAGLTIAALTFVVLAYSLGVVDGLDAAGGGSAVVHPLGAETTVVNDGDGIAVEWRFTWPSLAVTAGTAVVAFVLGSRLWRLAHRGDEDRP